jgi:alkylation response protein AidB-like acyl-CoA dehydrogenase
MYPRSVLPPETIDKIRDHAAIAENQGMLSGDQLQLIYEHKWFNLFVPQEHAGLALSLPEAVALEENIAYADGSVGWVVTLCAGAAMFIGYLDEALATEIFADPFICIAGSGQAGGSAKIIPGGFLVNGSWPYASGAPHATYFTANCIIEGTTQIHSFIFKKEEVTLHANWRYLGLNATAGYSFAVGNLIIPANRSFNISPQNARLAHPVYRYPFLQLAETTIAANVSGMCLYFFDLATELIKKKSSVSEKIKNKSLQLATSSIAAMQILRDEFYNKLDLSWSSHIATGGSSALELKAVSHASLKLATVGRNLVNQIYPYCGLDAARTDTAINRVWRNINTASQHSILLNYDWFD